MTDPEYLVSYGDSGEFGRFRPVTPGDYQRGDRVVVRSHQGLELAVVLCPVTAGHTPFLSRTALGEILRPAAEEDEQAAQRCRERGGRLFDDARRLAAQLELPLEVLDVEVLLDGKSAVVHHVRRQDCDYRPLVSALSHKHDILIVMQNLALPAEAPEGAGCGRPDCGQAGGGGCTSCGTGGGCSAGGCGKSVKPEEVSAYLAGLRHPTETRPARTPLL
jgi:hypothetical protein